MTYCSVKGCHNASHNKNKDTKIRFHSFPSNPIVAAQWIKKIRLNRREECWKPTKYTKICSEHFDNKEKYTTKGGFCKLRQGAVPTKGLHIFCLDEQQISNDDFHHPDDLDQGASSHEANENYSKINCNNTQASNEPISQEDDTDLESIFDTPRESALRKQLAKKKLLQRKHTTKIKSLLQKARRLKKKNMSLVNILITSQKKRLIDNDIANILSENVFAAQLDSNLETEASSHVTETNPDSVFTQDTLREILKSKIKKITQDKTKLRIENKILKQKIGRLEKRCYLLKKTITHLNKSSSK